MRNEKIERERKEILEDIFQHYWWNIRGFSYRINNNEQVEREMLALILEAFLNNEIRKPQEKVKINIMGKIQQFWRL